MALLQRPTMRAASLLRPIPPAARGARRTPFRKSPDRLGGKTASEASRDKLALTILAANCGYADGAVSSALAGLHHAGDVN
jgi:hypothetical protein